ncbi:pogo transposable element with KRAB domain-like [Brachionus plicatilis]|uniref:Pogo transposable element with KRAB domain-like n=1 Tax=Brachionus plicatilis TaxID=10195 RepID=A0A3M7SCZ6_BRAPC|nr:pogo transposable element with KRAB domain-like [Brachionus plicatilis]
MENRIKGVCLSGTVIKAKAAEYYHQYYVLTNQSNVEFKSSNGWFTNFCKRKNLVLRKITTSGRDLPNNRIEIVRIFFSECQILLHSPDFEPGIILNMDETSIYLDFPSHFTFEEKGTKRTAFSATANGEKLPVYALVPRKSELPNYTPPNNVQIKYKTDATFNEHVVVNYVKRIVVPHMVQKGFKKVNLFLDSAPCHLTKSVKDELQVNGIVTNFIPPRMTNLLQPADVCWFASIKKQYHNNWNKWFLEDERSFTRFGNTKSPGYVKTISWLSEIWKDFSSTLIIKSFSQCGIIDQFNLHSTLSYIMKTNTIIADYIDELDEGDEIDGFDTDPNIVFEINPSDTSSQPAQHEHNSPNDAISQPAQNVSPCPSNSYTQPAQHEHNSPTDAISQPAQNVAELHFLILSSKSRS